MTKVGDESIPTPPQLLATHNAILKHTNDSNVEHSAWQVLLKVRSLNVQALLIVMGEMLCAQ